VVIFFVVIVVFNKMHGIVVDNFSAFQQSCYQIVSLLSELNTVSPL